MAQITRRTLLGATASAGVFGSLAEPVRIAVIGTGARGSDLLRALSTIDACQIVGVCDNYPPHLLEAQKYAGAEARPFTNYVEMLEKRKPQAVVIAVPLHQHHRVASDCLAARADVFLEKTMCFSMDEARRLCRQVVESKQVFQVGLQRHANPIYLQALAMIETGAIGQITSIKAQWHRNNSWRRPVPVPKSSPEWPGLDRKLNWRLYKASSGGLMAELGSHQMDVANWFLGASPKRVIATGGIDHWRDGREVNDNVYCVYEYEIPSPAAATPQASRTVRVTYSSICNNAYEGAAELIMGTKGSLYLTSSKGLLFQEGAADRVNLDANAAAVTAGRTLKLSNDPWAHRGKPIEIDIEGGNDTRDELLSFVQHVQKRDLETICDWRTGLEDTATVLMANQAMETGRSMEFPADVRTLIRRKK